MPQLVEIPGIGQVEFPDGMSNEQITDAIHNDILKSNDVPQNPSQDQGSMLGNFASGVGRGFQDVGQGLKQLGLGALGALGVVDPNAQSEYTKRIDQERKAYNDSAIGQSTAGDVGRVIGNILPSLAVPGGVAGSLAARLGTGALAGMGMGAAQYVPEGESRATNVMLGGALGGTLPAVGAGISKTYNAITGNGIDPAAKALIDSGNKYGVRLGAADVSNNGIIKSIDQGLEEIPLIGTRGFREGQNQEAKNAAQRFVSAYENKMLNTPFDNVDQISSTASKTANSGNMDLLKEYAKISAKNATSPEDLARLQDTRAFINKNSSEYSASASKLLDSIEASGDDWQKIIETSGKSKLLNNKVQAANKYQLVEDLADKYGTVPISNTSNTLRSALEEATSSVLPDKDLVRTLNTLKNNFNGNQLNYSQLRQARADIGNLINDYYSGKNALLGSYGASALQRVKESITRDMDTFAQKNGPELGKAWKEADLYYKLAVAPYKDTLVAKALSNGAPDEIYSKFITYGGIEGGQGTTRASKLYNALDQKGQSAVRYGMVNNAFEKAYSPDSGAFSPAKFASELDRIAAAKGVFFKGTDKAEIDGFKNLMRHIERSNVAINKPETGVKNIPYIIGSLFGAGAIAAPGATAGIAASTYGLNKLFNTSAGRNFLLSASKIKSGSQAMDKFIEKSGSAIRNAIISNQLSNNKK